DGITRLSDFGLASAAGRAPSSDELPYVAPEQTRGGRIDWRADLFSMAVVLWEALSGQRLFKADTDAATGSRIMLEPIPLPGQVASGIPTGFDELCAKALQREPGARFQSASEMARAVEVAARLSGGTGVASAADVAALVDFAAGRELAAMDEAITHWA